jgi:hypothetical protein
MARRATSLKAMFSALRLGALATTTAWRTRSGYCSVQQRLHAAQAAAHHGRQLVHAQASSSRAWASTQSSTVTTGKSAPYTRPVSG